MIKKMLLLLLSTFSVNHVYGAEAASSGVAESDFVNTMTLTGHLKKTINSVAWAADGRLASGSQIFAVAIWYPRKSAEPIQRLTGHTGSLSSVAWAADGRQLAAGSLDATEVVTWDTATSREPLQRFRGPKGKYWSVAWAADGRLAAGSLDATEVVTWDTRAGSEPIQLLTGHTGRLCSVAWAADGKLASGSLDEVAIWDPRKSAEPIQLLTGPKGEGVMIKSVAWAADGRLAAGSVYGTVSIWDPPTSAEPIQVLTGHKGKVLSVAWAVDGRLASASEDFGVRIWEKPVRKLREKITKVSAAVQTIRADDQLAQQVALLERTVQERDRTIAKLKHLTTEQAEATAGLRRQLANARAQLLHLQEHPPLTASEPEHASSRSPELPVESRSQTSSVTHQHFLGPVVLGDDNRGRQGDTHVQGDDSRGRQGDTHVQCCNCPSTSISCCFNWCKGLRKFTCRNTCKLKCCPC